MQRAPAEIKKRCERFGIQLTIRERGAIDHRANVDSIGVEGRDAEHRHHRWRDVDERDAFVDFARARHARTGDDQRHPQRRVVDENTVTDLAMFAERFAVIGGNNDDRVVSN